MDHSLPEAEEPLAPERAKRSYKTKAFHDSPLCRRKSTAVSIGDNYLNEVGEVEETLSKKSL